MHLYNYLKKYIHIIKIKQELNYILITKSINEVGCEWMHTSIGPKNKRQIISLLRWLVELHWNNNKTQVLLLYPQLHYIPSILREEGIKKMKNTITFFAHFCVCEKRSKEGFESYKLKLCVRVCVWSLIGN